MALHLVKNAPARKRPRLQRLACMLECPRCQGHEVIQTKIGVLFVNGKTQGGTKQTLCVLCLMKGERVVLA